MENNPECSKQSTREKILEATSKIIGEEGFQNVTIKKIAMLADVNIAAVNYHFGSKDNVINEVMKIFTSKLRNCFTLLEDRSVSPKERLRNFLQSYSDTTLECPDVFRNIVNHSFKDFEMPDEYVLFLESEGYNKIIHTFHEAGINETREILVMKVFQALSAVEFPLLIGKYTEKISGIEYQNKEVRKQYIELILRSLFAE